MDADVREALISEVERCFSVARALGGDYELRIQRGYPPMFNDNAVSDQIKHVARDLLGADAVAGPRRTMGSEDFSFMTEAAPGAMFNLGVRKPGIAPTYVHTPIFNPDEDALPLGSALLAETALRLLDDARQ
jgi:amidohydrolase